MFQKQLSLAYILEYAVADIRTYGTCSLNHSFFCFAIFLIDLVLSIKKHDRHEV